MDDPRSPLPSTAPPEAPAPRTAALVAGGIGVLALAAALVVYLVGGAPYSHNVGGGVLYVLGLTAALVASVLLWMSWSPEPASRSRASGVATTTAALLLTCASGVVTVSHAAGGGVQLALMGATAAVLAAAVAVRAATR